MGKALPFIFAGALLVFALTLLLSYPQSVDSSVGRTTVWADCELFGSVVTPATFNPNSTLFDQLYAASFKDGVGLISDSKPGDADYNGGRWHMNALKSGVPADKYANACSVEELDLNDFESTGNYFECPLLPQRGSHQ